MSLFPPPPQMIYRVCNDMENAQGMMIDKKSVTLVFLLSICYDLEKVWK